MSPPLFDDENELLGCKSTIHATHSVINTVCVRWKHLVYAEMIIIWFRSFLPKFLGHLS